MESFLIIIAQIKYTIQSIVCEASCHPVIQVIWIIWIIRVIWIIQVIWVIRVIQVILVILVIWVILVIIFNIVTNEQTTLGSPGLLRRQTYCHLVTSHRLPRKNDIIWFNSNITLIIHTS